MSSRNLIPSLFSRATVDVKSETLSAQWSTMCPRVLTRPPPGQGRIEIEMSSKNTAPEGSRTKPGNLANDGHVGGAYGCLQSPAGLGAPPGFGGTVAPRCITYHSIAHNGCSCYIWMILNRSTWPA